MPDLTAEKSPYLWLMTGKAAVSWATKALISVTARMNELNPITDMEELAYARKTRDALQKALKEILFIENIKP